jgi:hypothetical protein
MGSPERKEERVETNEAKHLVVRIVLRDGEDWRAAQKRFTKEKAAKNTAARLLKRPRNARRIRVSRGDGTAEEIVVLEIPKELRERRRVREGAIRVRAYAQARRIVDWPRDPESLKELHAMLRKKYPSVPDVVRAWVLDALGPYRSVATRTSSSPQWRRG